MDANVVSDSLRELRSWVERSGWAGHDPFDVRAHPAFLALSRRSQAGDPLARAAHGALHRLDQRHPKAARALFRTRPTINAKAMGLFARAYGLLARTGDAAAGEESERRLDWLRANTAPDHPGVSWGYPFDWQSRVFVPAGTPNAVVTATVADAFRAGHRRDGRDADLLRGVARFLSEGLARPYDTPGEMCFSYTPVDSMCIHNANLIAGEFLLWAGDAFDDERWREMGRRAFAYTIAAQEPSGAWDYWGPPDQGRAPRVVDPYHTGFVLRMLVRAHAATNEPAYLEAARRGYRFLIDVLVDRDRPRATDTQRHPVNGLAVGELLLTHRALRALDPSADDRAHATLSWANDNMRGPDGHYYYLWWPHRANRLPMMRWVQAWMFLALAAWQTGERLP